jgi:hypothetical protein
MCGVTGLYSPDVDPAVRYRVCPNVVSRNTTEGGLLLVDLGTGTTWRVNQVGADVFRVLGRPLSLSELVEDLRRKYDVDSAVLAKDIDELLAELSRQRLVETVSDSVR